MGHVTRDAGWCVIDINTSTGQILLIQKWAYRWQNVVPFAPWSVAEKQHFHRQADLAIWAAWSNRARMTVSGTSDFARRFARSGAPINLDIQWVTTGQHWTVFVHKIAEGKQYPSEVKWTRREIFLGARDHQPVQFNRRGTRTRQVTVAHEFGHSAGNTGVLNRGDEYEKRGRPLPPDVDDTRSIMNVGNELRVRHFRTIVEQLNQMIAGTTFAVRSIR